MEPFRFTMQKVSDGLIEGAYVGYLDEQDVAVVEQTDRLLAQTPGRVELLYDLSQMTGFHRSQVGRHGDLFTRHRDKIIAIALVGVTKPTIRYGAITVSLIARLTLKTFDTRPPALDWLASLRSKR